MLFLHVLLFSIVTSVFASGGEIPVEQGPGAKKAGLTVNVRIELPHGNEAAVQEPVGRVHSELPYRDKDAVHEPDGKNAQQAVQKPVAQVVENTDTAAAIEGLTVKMEPNDGTLVGFWTHNCLVPGTTSYIFIQVEDGKVYHCTEPIAGKEPARRKATKYDVLTGGHWRKWEHGLVGGLL